MQKVLHTAQNVRSRVGCTKSAPYSTKCTFESRMCKNCHILRLKVKTTIYSTKCTLQSDVYNNCHIFTHTHTHTHTHTRTYTHTHTYTPSYTIAHTHTHLHTQNENDPKQLLSSENIDKKSLECYAIEATAYATDGALGSVEFEKNHRGENDVALFDFTSLFASENAARIIERKGKRILLCVTGDSLLEVIIVKATSVKQFQGGQ